MSDISTSCNTCNGVFTRNRPKQVNSQSDSLFRSHDWLPANQGPVFLDSVEGLEYSNVLEYSGSSCENLNREYIGKNEEHSEMEQLKTVPPPNVCVQSDPDLPGRSTRSDPRKHLRDTGQEQVNNQSELAIEVK
eukprot:sb/3474804/